MFKGGAPSLTGMAQDLFEGEKVLAFDLETTGVSTNNDRIVQYALIGTLADGTAVNVEQLVKTPVFGFRSMPATSTASTTKTSATNPGSLRLRTNWLTSSTEPFWWVTTFAVLILPC